MTSRVAEMARQAATEVRTRGLAKGSYEDANGRVCAIGATRLVERPGTRDIADGVTLRCAFGRAIGSPTFGIHAWNDAPEGTAEDVALMFERVAEQFESPTQPRQSA